MTGASGQPAGPAPSRVHQLAGLHRLDLLAAWITVHPHIDRHWLLDVVGGWSTEQLITSILDVTDQERSTHDRTAGS